jgi:hypothetical protein
LLHSHLKSFDVALATPMALLPDSPKRELRLQFALGYGESGAIKGAAASPGALRIRQDLVGVAAAMGFVVVGQNVRGLVGSVGYAGIEGRLAGAAMSVGVARARALQGFMLSGGATLLREPSRAVLLTGGVNVAGDLTGIQMAGAVNVARDLTGISLAVVNVQRRVRGLQIGIVNVADEVDGGAIGIISMARNGRLQPVLWGSNGGSAHVALKSIAGYAFTQLGGGMNLDRTLLLYDGGIGAHLRVGKHFFVEPGLHYTSTHELTPLSAAPDRYYLSYLAMGGLRLGDAVDLLAGGGLRHTLAGALGEPDFRPEVRAGIGFF